MFKKSHAFFERLYTAMFRPLYPYRFILSKLYLGIVAAALLVHGLGIYYLSPSAINLGLWTFPIFGTLSISTLFWDYMHKKNPERYPADEENKL